MTAPLVAHRSPARRSFSRSKGLPLPSNNFPPQYEMKGAFVPLVEGGPPSAYPAILQPTYVISIRPERLVAFARRVGAWMVHCQRPPCVVGKKLDKSKLVRERVLHRNGGALRLGEIGCFLSHLKAWQCIARAPYPYGTVMEDDAALGTNLRRVDEAMAELKNKNVPWDVLFWCHSPMPHVKTALQPCGLLHWSRVPHNNCMGCIAYTLTKRVAERWASRALPIDAPVDTFVCQDFEKTLNVYCLRPALGSVVTSSSDTADTKHPGYLRFL